MYMKMNSLFNELFLFRPHNFLESALPVIILETLAALL